MSNIEEKYRFEEYSKAYMEWFEHEKDRLLNHLGKEIRIEHFGSTSVPGLGGKPVVDMYVVVPKDDLEHFSILLKELGYEFRPLAGTPERLFHKGLFHDANGCIRRFQIHLIEPHNPDFDKDIGFRNWLRAHPEDRQEYEDCKRHAAEMAYGDGQRYKELKTGTLEEILRKALANRSNA